MDPHICSDGITYEKSEIARWLQANSTSPKTNKVLPDKKLIPNYALKCAIEKFMSSQPNKSRRKGDTSVETVSAELPDVVAAKADAHPKSCETDKKKPMQIFVRTLSNVTIAVKVYSNATVLDLMDEIQRSRGVERHQQRLIFSGKQLVQTRRLSDYNIRPGSCVHLVLRLLGGASFTNMTLGCGDGWRHKRRSMLAPVAFWGVTSNH